ncbi:uncharacterized protein CLUP02_15532 [Colletotrichum lupini]|uniref:Uncharacterized protein n=1 Tax=Colletotrichum lupini TaxID=145971 RepID=A0A9Q8T695_9PEZI|nr:uncharacterized protein CLUP02_15532 [Colletotrichum lupini]UQC90001.1 hypothetical protein CLUP02_15532 [Colletotrichum lupini]
MVGRHEVLNFNGDVEVSGERAKWANIYCSSELAKILSILIASNIAQSCSPFKPNKSTKQTHQYTDHHSPSIQSAISGPKMPVDKSAPLGLGALGQLDAVAIVANVGTPKKWRSTFRRCGIRLGDIIGAVDS